MNWENVKYMSVMFLFFILPFVLLYFFRRPVNRFLSRSNTKIRFIDLLPIYFMVGIHIYSYEAFGRSLLAHYLIFLSAIAMLLASVFYIKNKKLPFLKFLRVWWRLQDLLSLALFFIFGISFFVKTIL